MEERVYLNGDLVPRSQARLSPFDHGFLYGYGLFETMRAYRGFIFRLDRHLKRLQRSAETIGITSGLDFFELKRACYSTLEANNLAESRIRLTVSVGEGDIVPNLPTSCDITVFVAARELVPLPHESYEQGFKTILSSWRRNSRSPLSQLKSTCYLESVLARQEAKAAGADEAMLLNERGSVAEGSGSNVFLVTGERLITPSPESGILPGITREAVLELARFWGFGTEEREMELEEVVGAEEAFLTNSILEIMPLTWFDGKPVGQGEPGALTQRLMSAYKGLVEEERRKELSGKA